MWAFILDPAFLEAPALITIVLLMQLDAEVECYYAEEFPRPARRVFNCSDFFFLLLLLLEERLLLSVALSDPATVCGFRSDAYHSPRRARTSSILLRSAFAGV